MSPASCGPWATVACRRRFAGRDGDSGRLEREGRDIWGSLYFPLSTAVTLELLWETVYFGKAQGARGSLLQSPRGFPDTQRGQAVWAHGATQLPTLSPALPSHSRSRNTLRNVCRLFPLRLLTPEGTLTLLCGSGSNCSVPGLTRTGAPPTPHSPSPQLSHRGPGATWELFPLSRFLPSIYYAFGTDPGAGPTERQAKQALRPCGVHPPPRREQTD